MASIADIPCWYLLIALLVSAYHAYRGFMFQWIIAIQQSEDDKHHTRKWSKTEIVVLRSLEDMLFYFVCSLATFLALFVANSLYKSFTQLNRPIETGASVLMLFSFLLGIIGVSGQLPLLIQLGRLPGVKQSACRY